MKKILSWLTVLSLLMNPSVLWANGLCLPTVVRPVYAAPTYYPPYYPPVQYQQESVSPVVVVGIPVTNLDLPYYWSVGQELREERIAQQAAALLRSRQVTTQTQVRPKDTVATQQLSQTPQVQQSAEINFDVVDSQTSSSADQEVRNIFQTSCVKCHKPGTDKPGGIQLLTAASELFRDANPAAESARRSRIHQSVTGGEGVTLMPKNGRPLTVDKLEVVNRWRSEVSN